MSIVRRLIFILPCVFFAVQVWGQAARSPFTAVGIGEPYGSALINTQGMAGVGTAQPQIYHLNNQNPALLVYNTMTVFQAGIYGERRVISQDTTSENSVGGNMMYLATAFPVKPYKWTTSLGLMPYTAVKYKLQYFDEIINSSDTIAVREEGSGGLTQLYWSNGVRITKNLTVGLKAAYIFGSTTNEYSNILLRSDQVVNFYSTIEDKSYVQDLMFTGGVSYTIDSLFARQRYRLSFGATYTPATNLNTRVRSELYRSTLVSQPIDKDTLYIVKGQTFIPAAFTAGVSLSRGLKWSVGADFSYQDWSAFKSITQDGQAMGKATKIAFGGEFTPDVTSEKFLKRVIYRAGFSAEQYPMVVNGNKVNDLGINFGFSLPAGRSSLDFAFRYGKRGDKQDNTLEETYFKAYFGITFNDNSWFIKRKFD